MKIGGALNCCCRHLPSNTLLLVALYLRLPFIDTFHSQNVQSITGAVMNFLTALSLVNNGVREILPLVRYISQFIDFEFNQIKKQDQGKGVVCAATW